MTEEPREFDSKRELAAFYERHFDELCEACLEASSTLHRWSPLNTLPREERMTWITVGFSAIVRDMLGIEMPNKGHVYYPRVSELEDAPFFGMADVIDSCECALLPDEGILPLLFKDYADRPDELYELVVEFRRAQNAMTKVRTRQQMNDLEEYVEFVRAQAVQEGRAELERDLYRRFYLALKSLQDKTADLYGLVGHAEPDYLRSEVTQLKMMEADLLSEVFRVAPSLDSGRGASRSVSGTFRSRCVEKGLTPRELDVVELVVRGLSNAEVAERLGLASNTVKNYLASALSKLGKKNRAQLASFAAENGFFDE